MVSAKKILPACILVAAVLAGCSAVKPQRGLHVPEAEAVAAGLERSFTAFAFRDEFSAILSRIISTTREESGDWKGDLQGDATAFAPMLLYDLSRDLAYPDLAVMADRTVAYEARRVKRCFYLPWPDMDLVIGIPALAQPFLKNNDTEYNALFLKCVRIGYRCVSISPRFLTPFVRDRASAYGLMSYMCFMAADLSQDIEEKDSFVGKGVDLIEKADRECWDAGQSLYRHTVLADWPQQTMIMALVRAYHATGETSFLSRALAVFGTMDRRLYDPEKGGYFGHISDRTKGLSGNNNMAWVLLDLFGATNDRKYLDKAAAVLRWVLTEDLYDSRQCAVFHHYEAGGGRAGYSCTGCNLQTLVCIYRYNVLMGNRKLP